MAKFTPVVVAVGARAVGVAEDALELALDDTVAAAEAIAVVEAKTVVDAKAVADAEAVADADAEVEAEAEAEAEAVAVSVRIPTCADKLQLELLDTLTKATEPLPDAMADAEIVL